MTGYRSSLLGLAILLISVSPAVAQRQKLNCWGCIAGRCAPGEANGANSCNEYIDGGGQWHCFTYGGSCGAFADSSAAERILLTTGEVTLAMRFVNGMYMRPSCDGESATLYFETIGGIYHPATVVPLAWMGESRTR